MKSLLPVYIAIFTVVIVMFFVKNYASWDEMDSQQKMWILGLFIAGLLVLVGFLVGYLFMSGT